MREESLEKEYKNSVVIQDTSVLIKNSNVLNYLLEDFKDVIISQTILDELNFQKDKKKNNQAWLAMQKIEQALPRQYDSQGKFAVHKQQLMNGVNEFFNYSGIKCSEAAKRRESIIKKYLWVIDYHNMCCRRYQYPAGIIEYTNSIDATFNTSLPVLK